MSIKAALLRLTLKVEQLRVVQETTAAQIKAIAEDLQMLLESTIVDDPASSTKRIVPAEGTVGSEVTPLEHPTVPENGSEENYLLERVPHSTVEVDGNLRHKSERFLMFLLAYYKTTGYTDLKNPRKGSAHVGNANN